MFSNKITKKKELLVRLATDKNGLIKFKSKLLYNQPYLYHTSEELRYYLWMIELCIYLENNFDWVVIALPFNELDYKRLEKELLSIVEKIK